MDVPWLRDRPAVIDIDTGRQLFVDDFLIVQGADSLHVCNAPSPAATASLEIGRLVADMLPAG